MEWRRRYNWYGYITTRKRGCCDGWWRDKTDKGLPNDLSGTIQLQINFSEIEGNFPYDDDSTDSEKGEK